MNHIEPDSSLQNIGYIRLFTAVASLLLSVYAFYSDDIINADGILYLNMAEAYLNGGLAATKNLFDWPFYSILIAYTHQLLSFSFATSAAIINTVFFVILTDSLILISRRLIENRSQLIIAALLILCFHTLSEYRDFIIRDAGYWAFASLALYRFMSFIEQSSLTNALYWLTPAIIATLFRIEGVVILLALPFYLLISHPPRHSLSKSIRLGSVLIISIAIIGLIAENQTGLSSAFTKLQTISHYINLDTLLTVFDNNIAIIETQVLNKYSAEYSGLILVAGLLAMLTYKLIKSLSFGYITLYLIGRWQQKENDTPAPYRSLLIYFIAINIAILVVFMFKQYFITTRYTVTTTLGLLLLIMPVVCRCLEQAWSEKQYKIIGLAFIILLVSLVDAMTQSNSKSYIKDTAHWASQNLPEASIVLTDNEFIYHYFYSSKPLATLCAGKIFNNNTFRIKTAKHQKIAASCPKKTKHNYLNYDYLIVVEKRKHQELKEFLKELPVSRVYHFENKRGDGAYIYKVNH